VKGPVKAAALGAAALVLAGAAFWGGTLFQSAKTPSWLAGTMPGADAQGGPMGGMTDDERAELASMTDEERQQWFAENMGDRPAGAGGPARGGSLEGEVVEVASDTITLSVGTGSQTIYTDDDTVVAFEEGAGALAPGAQVMVVAEPTAEGVTTASLVVVTQ
jgi:hypothetical protein